MTRLGWLALLLGGCSAITSPGDFVFEPGADLGVDDGVDASDMVVSDVADADAPELGECSEDRPCPGVASAAVVCVEGTCEIEACVGDTADCDGRYETGCEVDTATSLDHCGACGEVCERTGAAASCEGGVCTLGECDAERANCNGDPLDGCEASFLSPASCGGCGRACGEDSPLCRRDGAGAFECAVSCAAGEEECDAACFDTASSPEHCGGCGVPCDAPSFAAATCTDSTCGFTCNAGRGDCDAMDGDGCEVDLLNDPSNCGGCGTACTGGNATWACNGGDCMVVACEMPFADCNGMGSDGCEIDVRSDANHCGGCGQVCEGTCVEGACDPVTDLAIGSTHGCAVRTSGTVVCWGGNGRAQLGDSTFSARAEPAAVRNEDGTAFQAQDVAVGFQHACAIQLDGTIACWGNGTQAETGPERIGQLTAPRRVIGSTSGATDFDGRRFTRISAGFFTTCAVDTMDDLWCWGVDGAFRLLGGGSPAAAGEPVRVTAVSDVADVAVSSNHVCALELDGDVWCWGRNNAGQAGHGTPEGSGDFEPPGQVPLPSAASKIALSGGRVCAIVEGGDLYCWGSSAGGALGVPGANTVVPVQARTGVTDVATGDFHTCAVVDGRAECWGSDSRGMLGNGDEPGAGMASVPVTGFGSQTRFFARENTACAIEGTRVRCWGDNRHGVLAFDAGALASRPVAVAASTGVNAISASATPTSNELSVFVDQPQGHGCSVVGAELRCFGSPGAGRLGRSSSVPESLAMAIGGLPVPVAAVVSNNAGTFVVAGGAGARSVYAFGANTSSRFGLSGSVFTAATRVPTGAGDVDEAGLGDDFGCVRKGGEVFCFGRDNVRQLGRATAGDDGAMGAPVDGIADALELDLGGQVTGSTSLSFACVRRATGAVACWGNDVRGQLGDGSPGDASGAASDVVGLSGVLQLSTGVRHACAIVQGAGPDGQGFVRCWGDNRVGQCAQTPSASPLPVTTVADAANDFVEVAAYDLHTCARRVGGEVLCWGSNINGRLGNGSAVDSATPVRVSGLTGATALGTGNGAASTCAITGSGGGAEAFCWGLCGDGACGSGRSLVANAPTPLIGLP
ncbi:MAG: hypothetical protein AAF411_03510 [Myxococcota bacterium]